MFIPANFLKPSRSSHPHSPLFPQPHQQSRHPHRPSPPHQNIFLTAPPSTGTSDAGSCPRTLQPLTYSLHTRISSSSGDRLSPPTSTTNEPISTTAGPGLLWLLPLVQALTSRVVGVALATHSYLTSSSSIRSSMTCDQPLCFGLERKRRPTRAKSLLRHLLSSAWMAGCARREGQSVRAAAAEGTTVYM